MPEKNILYAIILAAGKGTRFKSDLPKVLHRIGGRTLLEQTVRACAPITKQEIVVVAGFGFELVSKELEIIKEKLKLDLKISIVKQTEQLGTGHAALVGLSGISENNADGSLLVVPGDCPLLSEATISEFVSCEVNKAEATKASFSILTVELDNPFGFGRIVRDSSTTANLVSKIVEEKDCTAEQKKITEINTGVVLSTLAALKEYLPKLGTNNSQSEYYLTDVPELLIKDNKSVSAYITKNKLSVRGVNSRLELSVLESEWRQEHLSALALSGVTIESFANTFIDLDAVVEPDVFIGAGTRIYGKSIIKSGSILEGDTLIRDSVIGQNCNIRLGSYVDSAVLENNIAIGPFCHIRPKSHLMNNVKIGNFVETKAALLHEGVKANHLAYLGDLEIGAETNIGAGTIVCNYDGTHKHRSQISSKVFIGSNSTLISPVEIGEGAYVAAGSVINQNVPSGALGVGRSKQVNKEGWASRKRKAENKSTGNK